MSENDEFDDLIQEIEGKIQKDESEIYTERTREEAYNPKKRWRVERAQCCRQNKRSLW